MWFFILSGLIAWTGKPVSSSCSVQMSPSKAVVRFGDRLSANCSSLSNQTAGMGWEASIGGISLTRNVSSLTLNADSITDWSFSPQCYMNLQNGQQCFEFLPVTVYKEPDVVSMSLLSPMDPMIEGKEYRMRCDVVNVAPERLLLVHWLKGKKVFFTEGFKGTSVAPVNKSSVVSLKAHRDDNGTQVWCEAWLDFGPSVPVLRPIKSKSHEATVLYPPTFPNPEHEIVELTSSGTISLNCTAKGNPAPVYRWDIPDPVRQANKDQKMNQPILSPTLQLPGSYNCTASNKQGTTTKHFTVIEVARDRTVFAALVGGFVALGALLFIAGFFIVKPDGTFSVSKSSYQRGQPTTSGPV